MRSISQEIPDERVDLRVLVHKQQLSGDLSYI
jgi:ribosome-binding factor A